MAGGDAFASGGGISELSSEDVQTFGEGNVTVTHNNTKISSESAELTTAETIGTTADTGLSGDTNQYGYSNPRGVIINPNKELDGVNLECAQGVTGTTHAYLKKESDGTVLDKVAYTGGSDNPAKLRATLQSGTEYRVVVDNENGDYDLRQSSSASYPYSSTDVDIPKSSYGGNTNTSYRYSVSTITAITVDAKTSGDTLIEFDNIPQGLSEWGYIEFTRTLNGETVSVDVELDDGTVIATDVPNHFPLAPIDSAKNVRVRANISRKDTNNNPTLDSLTRSYRA